MKDNQTKVDNTISLLDKVGLLMKCAKYVGDDKNFAILECINILKEKDRLEKRDS